jgi:hypothetical protein
VPVDPDVVAHLQHQARNHLRTARAGVDLGDGEGAFQLAYDACRKLCLALLLAAGFRPKNDKGHHVVTFEGAATLAANFGARRHVDDAGDLRYARNSAEYRAETIAVEDANDAILIGTDLMDAFTEPIRKLLDNTSS